MELRDSGSVTIPHSVFGESDARAPRRIESLNAVSCYNKIIAENARKVNQNLDFSMVSAAFLPNPVVEDQTQYRDAWQDSIVLLIFLVPLFVNGVPALLGQVEGNQSACGTGQTEEEDDQGPARDPGGRIRLLRWV